MSDRFILWLADALAEVRHRLRNPWSRGAAEPALPPPGPPAAPAPSALPPAGATLADAQTQLTEAVARLSPRQRIIGLTSVGVIVICLAAAGVFLLSRNRNPATPIHDVFFYDVGNGQLFAAAGDTLPPVKAPSRATLPDGQPGGVRAYVLACGGCQDRQAWFVSHVERLDPEVRKSLLAGAVPEEAPEPSTRPAVVALVASPDDLTRWVPAHSAEAEEIAAKAAARCPPDRPPHPCLPQ